MEIDAIGFDLKITNGLKADLGGAIVKYELWSADRPKALASSYAQYAHSMRGGLLSGETATLREFIGLTDRAMQLATSASTLTVTVSLLNVADLDMKPIGSEYDPFSLWEKDPSTETCERRPD
jgi:hypothetical protein